jgi:hypothetical protein
MRKAVICTDTPSQACVLADGVTRSPTRDPLALRDAV